MYPQTSARKMQLSCDVCLQLIAASTLYLAGKVKDDTLKIRDIINVAHNTLNRGSSPLEIGDEYWNMRDAIVQAELLIMRMLKFEVSIVHPHKYMLHYLRLVRTADCTDHFRSSILHDIVIVKYSPGIELAVIVFLCRA